LVEVGDGRVAPDRFLVADPVPRGKVEMGTARHCDHFGIRRIEEDDRRFRRSESVDHRIELSLHHRLHRHVDGEMDVPARHRFDLAATEGVNFPTAAIPLAITVTRLPLHLGIKDLLDPRHSNPLLVDVTDRLGQ